MINRQVAEDAKQQEQRVSHACLWRALAVHSLVLGAPEDERVFVLVSLLAAAVPLPVAAR
jgi:hypothetical protein